MKVVLSDQSREDVRDILNYTQTTYGKNQRDEVKQILYKNIALLGVFPQIAPEDKYISVRTKLVSRLPLVIVYSTDTKNVRIVTILHTKRNR